VLLASGGSDNEVHIWDWVFVSENPMEEPLDRFTKRLTIKTNGWVRSVQWAPTSDDEFRLLGIASEVSC